MMQIAERVGSAKAAEMVFLSEPATAEQMLQWNVVNWVVDDAEFRSRKPPRWRPGFAEGPTKSVRCDQGALAHAGWREGVEGRQGEVLRPFDAAFRDEDARIALRNAAEAINAGKPFPKATFAGK